MDSARLMDLPVLPSFLTKYKYQFILNIRCVLGTCFLLSYVCFFKIHIVIVYVSMYFVFDNHFQQVTESAKVMKGV